MDGMIQNAQAQVLLQQEELPKVVMISIRMGGHAGASGYDRLKDYIDASMIDLPDQWTLRRRALSRSLRFMIKRSGAMWYQRANLVSELNAAQLWCRHKGQIFHFLYGENSYRYLGNLKKFGSRNAIVCTYHTPPDTFAKLVHDRSHLAHLDAAIVVSNVQVEFLSDIIGQDRVFYVPHGIDVDYFSPNESKEHAAEHFRCLFVGSYLRDIETLVRTAKLLDKKKNVRFSVVTRPEALSNFKGLDNVDTYSGVGDLKLLELYQNTDLFVFPLLDCTANNSLLEAMACGMPIVSTDLPGVKDYVDGECAVLVQKGNAEMLADAIVGLSEDAAKRRMMSKASRLRAMDFRWEAIADRTMEVYQQINIGS